MSYFCHLCLLAHSGVQDEQWKHKLIIANIQEVDSGVYSCEWGTTKTRCVLKVQGCIIYLY